VPDACTGISFLLRPDNRTIIDAKKYAHAIAAITD